MQKATGKLGAPKATESPEGTIIKIALRDANGDIKTAARTLGLRPQDLGQAMSEHEIDLRGVSCW